MMRRSEHLRRLTMIATAALTALGSGAGGCIAPKRVAIGGADLDGPTRPHRVYLIPGIAGSRLSLFFAQRGMRDGGAGEIEVYEWRRGVRFLDNLTDLVGNRLRAKDLALRIAKFARSNENAAVDLVGYSGGGGLALLAAEALPEDVRLRNLVLVHPAISPAYDLEPALAKISGELHLFYSPADWFILGWGTGAFGTIDREYSDSAGRIGFDLERAVRDPQQRARVRQTGWRAEMIFDGHFGNHASMLGYGWNRRYVAPLLKAPLLEAPLLEGPLLEGPRASEALRDDLPSQRSPAGGSVDAPLNAPGASEGAASSCSQ